MGTCNVGTQVYRDSCDNHAFQSMNWLFHKMSLLFYNDTAYTTMRLFTKTIKMHCMHVFDVMMNEWLMYRLQVGDDLVGN